MKKKLYLQPDTEAIGVLSIHLMEATRGWAKDGNPPTKVEVEGEVEEADKLPPSDIWGEGYGGFLDLD